MEEVLIMAGGIKTSKVEEVPDQKIQELFLSIEAIANTLGYETRFYRIATAHDITIFEKGDIKFAVTVDFDSNGATNIEVHCEYDKNDSCTEYSLPDEEDDAIEHIKEILDKW